MQIPDKYQFLYSQLAVTESLAEYIRAEIPACEFDDPELKSHMDSALEGIRAAFFRMRYIIKKHQENRSGCY